MKKSRILVDFAGENETATASRTMSASWCAAPNTRVNLSAARRSIGYQFIQETHPAMKPFERITNPREIRRRLRLNQQEFWSRVGVTQSGGSRYESGRTIPRPVRELLRLVHIEGIELAKARGRDFEVVSHLKATNPRLYNRLRKEALKKNGGRK